MTPIFHVYSNNDNTHSFLTVECGKCRGRKEDRRVKGGMGRWRRGNTYIHTYIHTVYAYIHTYIHIYIQYIYTYTYSIYIHTVYTVYTNIQYIQYIQTPGSEGLCMRLDKAHMQRKRVVKQQQKKKPCVKSSRFVYLLEELWVFVCIMDVDRLAWGKNFNTIIPVSFP